MPDAMIELDLTTSWDPPDPPPSPRQRARRRRLALVGVALLTAASLAGGAPARGTAPLFTLDRQVNNITAAGDDRIIITRARRGEAGQEAVALSIHDGRQLWSLPIEPDQRLAMATDHVVALITESGGTKVATIMLTVVDAGTGTLLWQRAQADILGFAAGRVVVQDLTGSEGVRRIFIEEQTASIPVNVADPAAEHDRRYLALDARTGAPDWEAVVPAGSVATLPWSGGYGLVAGMSELSPDGLLRTRDLGTGAVTAAHQLDWSGTISEFSTSSAFPGAPDQVVIYKAGERGADVYDRATGRRLWHWEGQHLYGGFAPCTPDLYCKFDQQGLAAVDARTGRQMWSVERYNGVIYRGSGVMVLSTWEQIGTGAGDAVVVDVRTGQISSTLAGWSVIQNPLGTRLVVLKQLDPRTVVLGTADPETGRVAVFGKARDWFGSWSNCVEAGDRLACVASGTLWAFQLP